MPDYEKMYFLLASRVADTVEALDKTIKDLKIIQFEMEEMYIDSEDEKAT